MSEEHAPEGSVGAVPVQPPTPPAGSVPVPLDHAPRRDDELRATLREELWWRGVR